MRNHGTVSHSDSGQQPSSTRGSTRGSCFQGTVSEVLPKALYRVSCKGANAGEKLDVVASVSASMRRVTVKILPGDRVAVEVSPYDPNRGRITSRLA